MDLDLERESSATWRHIEAMQSDEDMHGAGYKDIAIPNGEDDMRILAAGPVTFNYGDRDKLPAETQPAQPTTAPAPVVIQPAQNGSLATRIAPYLLAAAAAGGLGVGGTALTTYLLSRGDKDAAAASETPEFTDTFKDFNFGFGEPEKVTP